MKLCANLSLLFTEVPLLERIGAAAKAGFEGVEIQFPYDVPAEQLKAALDAAGLPLVLINLPAGDLMRGGPGLAAVPELQGEFDAALAQALEYARIVKPQHVNVLAGRLVEGLDREVALQTLAARLRATCDAFAGSGTDVLMEAINCHDMKGFLLNTPEHLQDMLERVARENLRAQLDLYHMARMGLELVDCIYALMGQIGHVQFADYPERSEPGSGETDFEAPLQVLGDVGYDGWLGAEYRPTGTTADSLRWLPAWRSSLAAQAL
ncbi:TIM barrel protein [Pseudomonas sp. ZM23]|uniref:TIM barrel protein n=1 Tax=Pseudomonas triclosanedens TaxID=2961893 RepID=A0ABY7A4X0_9PSED|nr:TIM barrel protein [Pseudomonas triclosanedens]MCP8464338.1 TIM barrel protein [Pseudomonas triclosanedens]MCP8471472.1 TIM barrel protein [Pseudomonas triclosanedens]MCP8477719.1 TIM barrel protein [Pseudomonas triclosanedens]WAI51174.1 TIM barrel protein [Pseudomonas triclosanedens]